MEIIEKEGRKLLVEFTCGRCGTKALVTYEHSENFGVKSNVGCNPVPPGWRIALGGLPLLCDKCHDALNEFMKKER